MRTVGELFQQLFDRNKAGTWTVELLVRAVVRMWRCDGGAAVGDALDATACSGFAPQESEAAFVAWGAAQDPRPLLDVQAAAALVRGPVAPEVPMSLEVAQGLALTGAVLDSPSVKRLLDRQPQ